MPELTVIWWRDIPAQVTAREGRTRAARELPPRFQEAIDAAAMRAGLIGSDSYMEEWRRMPQPCGDDLDAEVAREVERLDSEFPDEVLERLVRGNGKETG
ncbi:MAG TPA: virulence factor [Gaiella sp.]|jgi:hypothetical protein